MTKHILIDVKIDADGVERLRKIPGIEIELVEAAEMVRELPAEVLRNTDVLFCTFPASNFSTAKSLELIQLASAGYTQLMNLNLCDRGIRACNATGVNDIPIAEWNIAMMINLARDLRGLIRNQDAGIWDRAANFQKEIRGATVGIWGYGGIGRETARLAKAMGMRVFVLDAYTVGSRENYYTVSGTGDIKGVLPDQTFLLENQKEFLSRLDFLILSMPLTKRTEGCIGEEQLKALPKTAYLLNPARGPLVKEQALLKALKEGWIAGAALDTHYYYPMPADHPLWYFPNVIMTPHISGSTLSPNFLPRLWDLFCINIERFMRGASLLNELKPSQLKGE